MGGRSKIEEQKNKRKQKIITKQKIVRCQFKSETRFVRFQGRTHQRSIEE